MPFLFVFPVTKHGNSNFSVAEHNKPSNKLFLNNPYCFAKNQHTKKHYFCAACSFKICNTTLFSIFQLSMHSLDITLPLSKLSADTPFLEQTMNSEKESTVEPLASNSNSEGKWKIVWVSEGSSEMGRLQISMCHVKNW